MAPAMTIDTRGTVGTVGTVGVTGVVVVVAMLLAGASHVAIGADTPSARATTATTAATDMGPWLVRPPKSGQWTAKRRSKDGIAWVRDDGSIAYFQAFPLRRVGNEQALVNEVRTFSTKVLSGSGKGRIVDANYATSRARPYPCVKATLVVETAGAPAAAAVTAPPNAVRVQSRALICHSNEEPEVGVFIGFSYPGAVTSRPLEADAQAFINGATLVAGGRRKWER